MLDSLRHIVQQVASARDVDSVLRLIVINVKKAMKTEVCSIYLYDKASDRYVFMATEGLNQDAEGLLSLSPHQGLVGFVAQRAEPINLDNAASHKSYKLLPDIGEEPFHSFLGTPIIHHRNVLGVLVVQQRNPRKFDTAEEAFLVTIAAQLAGVIAHAMVLGAITPLHHRRSAEKNIRFHGIPASPGIAIGKAVLVDPGTDLFSLPARRCKDITHEIAFFKNCLDKTRKNIEGLKSKVADQLAKQEAALFDVFISMLDDSELGGEVIERIKQGWSAQTALSEVIHSHVTTFESMDDTYLRERAIDVKDLGQRVLVHLQKAEPQEFHYDKPFIAIGNELSASILGDITRDKLIGLISLRGSNNSHLAILARSMNIPAVMGLESFPLKKLDNQPLIIDGFNGDVIANASKPVLERYKAFNREEKRIEKELEQLISLPCKTLDQHHLTLTINTGLMTNTTRAIAFGAEGVGLFRTEIQFLMNERFPSEEEQFLTYKNQLEAFHPKPVTMRCLDIGGDKPLPYFPIKEDNPCLGWRGIRIILDHPEIFLVQIRALLKANNHLGNLKILLPMISQIAEFDEAKELILRAHAELIQDIPTLTMPEVGIMVEVPSAVYQIKAFIKRADFISVGSNDLSQYLLAVDRNNPRVSSLYSQYHPAILLACHEIAQACNEANKHLSLCGEMAGDPAAAVLLMAMGYDTLSMNERNLLRVKAIIRLVTLAKAKHILNAVLQLDSARDIQDYLYRNLEGLTGMPLFQWSNQKPET